MLPMTHRPIYLGYARKSRIDTRNRKELESTDRQIARLTTWAAEQGVELELFAEPDGHRSGGSIEQRPAYQHMLERVRAARPGELAGIVATELDRTGRLERDMHDLFDEVVSRGLRLIVLDDPTLNLESTDGRFLAGLKVLLAAQERRRITDRLRTSAAYRMSSGIFVGGPPYGYRWSTYRNEQDQQVKMLEPVPEEAERLNAIYRKYLEGHGTMAIAQWCNALGWTSKRGYQWQSQSIYELIRHIMTYRGYILYYRDKTSKVVTQMIEGRHPPIVDEDLATAVVAAFHQRSLSSNPGRRDGPVYPLRHRAWCAECGSTIVASTRRREGPNPKYFYRCSKMHACTSTRMPAEQLDAQVRVQLAAFRDALVRATALLPELAALLPPTPLPEPSTAGLLRAEMDRLNVMFRKGRISEDAYDRDFEALERKLALQTAAMEGAGSRDDPLGLAALQTMLGDLDVALTTTSRESLADAVKQLVERVEVRDGQVVLCRLIPPLEALRTILQTVDLPRY